MERSERDALIESRMTQERITAQWQSNCGRLGAENTRLRIAVLVLVGVLILVLVCGCGLTVATARPVTLTATELCGPSECAAVERRANVDRPISELVYTDEPAEYGIRDGMIARLPEGECSEVLESCGWVSMEDLTK